jgi:hypothetical protein
LHRMGDHIYKADGRQQHRHLTCARRLGTEKPRNLYTHRETIYT